MSPASLMPAHYGDRLSPVDLQKPAGVPRSAAGAVPEIRKYIRDILKGDSIELPSEFVLDPARRVCSLRCWQFEIVDSRYANPSDWLSYEPRQHRPPATARLRRSTPLTWKRLSPRLGLFNSSASPRVRRRRLSSPTGSSTSPSGGEEAFALDARTGRMLWDFNYPPPARYRARARCDARIGIAASPMSGNRKLFMATDDCSLLAIDARNGSLLWRVQLANPAGHIRDHRRAARGQEPGAARRARRRPGPDARLHRRLRRRYGQARLEAHHGACRRRAGLGDRAQYRCLESWSAAAPPGQPAASYDSALNLVYWPTGNPGPKDFRRPRSARATICTPVPPWP